MAQVKQTTNREEILNLLLQPRNKSSDVSFHYKGIPYPSTVCSKELLDALDTFEARHDDLLIASFPKCGTNWVFQILSEMVSILQNKEMVLDQLTFEFGNLQIFKSHKERPSPRIFSTHLRFQKIPKSFFEKKTKMLLVIRNPKDAATSYYRFHQTLPVLQNYDSWNMYFKDYMQGNVCYGSYFDYMDEWKDHIDEDNVMVITFEEMKTDFLTQLKNISEFLRLPLTEEQLCEVERRTSFASMKEKALDTHGKLGEVFIRKGQIGDWKSLFTEEQSKEMDEKFQQHLAGTKLGDLLNYTKYCKF